MIELGMAVMYKGVEIEIILVKNFIINSWLMGHDISIFQKRFRFKRSRIINIYKFLSHDFICISYIKSLQNVSM